MPDAAGTEDDLLVLHHQLVRREQLHGLRQHLALQLLPAGFATRPYRSTDATVFALIEGRGRTQVGDRTLEWGPRDVFVVPAWTRHTHQADQESVLFSFSNRPAQEKLGLFREERGD